MSMKKVYVIMYARTESNRNQGNRNPSFYPLNYGRGLQAAQAMAGISPFSLMQSVYS